MEKHTGDSYKGKAAHYALINEKKPIQVYYARPAMLSMMPSNLDGLTVLDVGCGSGWFTEYLLAQGASVIAFDYDQEFVDMTMARVDGRAKVVQADLSQPLTFLADNSIDLVVAPLVMHYVEDWSVPFAEFYRGLKPGGLLVFLTHHPFNDIEIAETDNYFEKIVIHDEWDIGPVSFYRRSLTEMSASLMQAGFLIERVLEPLPLPEYETVDPPWFEKLQKNPWFLGFRAVKG